MQTFLPHASFEDTARVLDYRRLGKQRVEAWQILNVLHGHTTGWQHHPAVKMWRGYELALTQYGIAITKEWKRRGFKDTMLERFEKLLPNKTLIYPTYYPQWFDDKLFHMSHQSNLIRKDKSYYGKLWPNIPDNLPYVWPV